ncbi:mannitol-1-phosphate 5-dehydrogenase [Paenibacillus barengoltzii]|uniref:Mannitol-1-phosphate 5-dehydrogenase n=1 Tax=Paenibacillus barengoltzii G22 TaxID=1235795 RepID=R9LHT0_9BACL|nr:mannitol-1-phosphate 5-dehydrogenase [Paenibacillus barengoltzii]EOS58285.1 mannitol-1-phosphate 5-dehydrogenase [Paenibacillus barengoltzii G22]
MKAVHFGAGNIGRGFIGLLLSRSGYEVCFVDVNEKLVSELAQRKEYPVTLASDQQETVIVKGVTAINSMSDPAAAAQAIAAADLVTTAVGVNILKHIAGTIAQGLTLRKDGAAAAPLHIIACENAIGGSSQLKEHVYAKLDEATRQWADDHVAFPDAAVDRIVPLQQHEDPLQVVVEPFYEWAVDQSQMFEGFHRVEGVHYVDRLEPYIERKLFTVNTGHCSAAYMGYLQGHATIQEAMNDQKVVQHVRAVLSETGAVLVAKHGFSPAEHQAYIDTILERFANPALTDEVSRVGRSPIRKLSAGDRLVSPATQAYEREFGYGYLALTMAMALCFDVPDDPEAAELQASLREVGASKTLAQYTGLDAEHPIHQAVLAHYEELKGR